MRLVTLYAHEFFQVASASKLDKKSICAVCPTAILPHSPLISLCLLHDIVEYLLNNT
jgi:hypothetical protein